MIDLYTAATPNGYKASIMLEECGLAYTPHILDLGAQDQKRPDFLAINPNGRIPALVDDGFAVFESGAILLYLAEKTGRLMGGDAQSRSRCVQWVMWQMGGLGPMMGQLNVFSRYFPERLPAAIERYARESYRLFGVLDGQLATSEHVAGADYSVADIACWPWIDAYRWPGLSLDGYPHLQRWYAVVGARPALQRGLTVPPRPDIQAEAERIVDSARRMLA